MVIIGIILNYKQIMHIEGFVTWVGGIQSGKGQRTGNDWQRQPFTVEYLPGQYPKSIMLDTMDSNIVGKLQVGQKVTVDFDCEVRDYTDKQGVQRKFNSFTIWRNGLHCVDKSQGQQAQGQSASAPAAAAPANQPMQPAQQYQQPMQPAQDNGSNPLPF